MPGLAIVSPASFNDPTLPKIDVSPVPTIRGALYDWAVDNLLVGDRITRWVDRASNTSMLAPDFVSQAPSVVDDPTYGKLLKFNGTNQRLDATGLSLKGPRTLISVGRLPEGKSSTYMFTQGQGTGYFNLGLNGAGDWQFYNNSGINHDRKGNSDLHVIVVTIDSGSSAISVDGVENAGSLDATTADTIRIAASASGYWPVEMKRLVILPYAAIPRERKAISSALMARYL